MTEPDGEYAAPSEPDYQELLLRAGYNFHVFLAGAFGFARQCGASPADTVRFIADRLTGTWAGLQGHGADAVLRLLLENLASTGYEVRDVDFGAEQSRATLGTVPLGLDHEQWTQLLAPFGVTPLDMHALFEVFTPLVASAGAELELSGFRDTLRLTVHRTPQRPVPADLA